MIHKFNPNKKLMRGMRYIVKDWDSADIESIAKKEKEILMKWAENNISKKYLAGLKYNTEFYKKDSLIVSVLLYEPM